MKYSFLYVVMIIFAALSVIKIFYIDDDLKENEEDILQKIRLHNEGNHTWKMENYNFVDKKTYLGLHHNFNIKYNKVITISERDNQLLNNINYEKYLTPVKDQGQCGSCWAFSIMGTISGNYNRNFNKNISFSEQYLIDKNSNNAACDGNFLEHPLFRGNGPVKDVITIRKFPSDTDCKYRYSKGQPPKEKIPFSFLTLKL